MKRRALLVIGSLAISSCGTTGQNAPSYLQRKGLTAPTPQSFQHCHGYGCKHVATVSLPDNDWSDIEHIFARPPKTAEEERQKISEAIGLFEARVGTITGTNADTHGTFINLGRYQHDCVDESTNTTVYLSLLQSGDLLRFHNIEGPTTRIPLLHYMGRWPHQTAVISEKESDRFFAVDSWFHDNGAPAEIVSLPQWKDGWKPEPKHDNF